MTRAQDSDRKLVGVRVLDVQPDLAETLDPGEAALARRHAVAMLESVPAGPWRPSGQRSSPAAIGLLVVDGLLVRDLHVGGRSCSELLGPGDLLRPWDDHDEDAGASLEASSSWNVLEPARIAVLDDRFARTACRWPQLIAALVARTLRRARWMTVMLAVSNLTRTDDRVLALLWHLADRWGRVTPSGVLVPVPLTHELIGRLVGAHRPSVTSALGELQRDALVSRTDAGWLLHGEPPRRLNARGGGGARVRFSFDPTLAAALSALAAGLLR